MGFFTTQTLLYPVSICVEETVYTEDATLIALRGMRRTFRFSFVQKPGTRQKAVPVRCAVRAQIRRAAFEVGTADAACGRVAK